MARYKRIVTAGPLVREVVYTAASGNESEKARAAKRKISSEAVRRMNQIYSYQKLEMILAANFVPGDLVVTLTYSDESLPESKKQAEERLRYFRAKLTKARKARKKEMRMVWCTECRHGEGRYHHHIVLNGTEGLDYDELRQCWIYGDDIEITTLKVGKDKNYLTQARYMAKEANEKRVSSRSWSYTRNCKQPETECYRVDEAETVNVPKGAVSLLEESHKTEYGSWRLIEYYWPDYKKRAPRHRKRKRTFI